MEEEPRLTPEEITKIRPDMSPEDIETFLEAAVTLGMGDYGILAGIVESAPLGAVGEALAEEILKDG